MNRDIVKIDRLVPRYSRETDPNKMGDEEFAKLVALMREVGCLTSVTVRRIDDRPGYWLLVDGHHRLWAAQVAGLDELPVVVEATGRDVRALGLGLNHVRGREDLRIVTDELRELTALLGNDDVSLLTGYRGDEIADLLAVQLAEPVMGASDDEVSEEPDEKRWVLEISFANKADYQRARRALMRASGDEKSLSAGLMSVLEES